MKHSRIGQFLVIGIGAVVCAFVLLGAGWLISLARLGDMKSRLFTDAQSLQYAQSLETHVLAVSRGNNSLTVNDTEQLLKQLRTGITSTHERRIADDIEKQYNAWKASPTQPATNRLLQIIRDYRHLNTSQMQQAMTKSDQLIEQVRWWTPLLIALSGLALGLGGLRLWTRIFRPTLGLAHAAEAFGQGDLTARAPVLGRDEMNDLCRTFNSMANAICEREQERLQFVATLTHDLKNPLVLIGGAAHLIHSKNLSPEQQDEWLQRIRRSVHQMEEMISGLMDGVQSLNGRLHLERCEVDLTEICSEVVCDWEKRVEQHGHLLRLEGNRCCRVLGDNRRLERVLNNLISNAVKYSEANTEIVVSLWKQGTKIRLAVKDQGYGIALEDRERIFQPFTRLDRTKDMATGTGLGLVSVKKIVEAHGGTVKLYSEINKGTTVEIWLKSVDREASHRVYTAASNSLQPKIKQRLD